MCGTRDAATAFSRYHGGLVGVALRFADSLLEGDGFEPSVPREVASTSPRHPEPSHRGWVSKLEVTLDRLSQQTAKRKILCFPSRQRQGKLGEISGLIWCIK